MEKGKKKQSHRRIFLRKLHRHRSTGTVNGFSSREKGPSRLVRLGHLSVGLNTHVYIILYYVLCDDVSDVNNTN